MLVNRRDISLINNIAPVDGGRSFLEQLKGNVSVNKQMFFLKNEPFRGNNYRSYVLNFSDRVPQDLPTTDKFASYFKNEAINRQVANIHNDDAMNAAERFAG